MKHLNSLISNKSSIKEALAKFNQLAPEALAQTTLFVFGSKKNIVGVLTEGDIRRAMLAGINLEESVEIAMNKQFQYFDNKNYCEEKLEIFKKKKIRFIPFLNKDKTLSHVIDLNDLHAVLPIEAVIMAGGKGERLRPLTLDMPKPMLKVGSKPILEHTILRIKKFGVSKFHLSVNYQKEKIQSYFENGANYGCSINYLIEKDPLGTIGSVGLAKNIQSDYLLVMNGDLLTNIDFKAFHQVALKSKAAICIATIEHYVDIPYAVLEQNGNKVKGLMEKPKMAYPVNAGIYMIRKDLLKWIPSKKVFHATDLIQKALDKGEKVHSFPINGYWTDIGRLEDYQKVQLDIQHLNW